MNKSKYHTGNFFRWPFLIILIFLVVFPFYWMIVTAIQDKGYLFSYPPQIIPAELNFEIFIYIFEEYAVGRWILNTFFVATLTALLTVSIASLSSYSITRFKFKGRRFILFFFLTSQMMPLSLMIIPMYIIWLSIGLIDTLFGLVLSSMTFAVPVCVLMLQSFFRAIPESLEDSAMIDGCNRIQLMRYIVFPLALPGLIACGVFAFLIAWDNYIFGLTLIYSNTKWIFSVGIAQEFMGMISTQWNQVMGAATVGTIIPVLLFFCVQGNLIRGLTSGAIKE